MRCNKCKRDDLTQEDFTLKYKGKTKRNSWCKSCIRQAQRNCYKLNPKRRKDCYNRRKRIYKENRIFILSYLLNNPCSICGEKDIRCLEFDHIDRKEKRLAIARMVSFSLNSLKKEMNKCRILCANCHKKITAEQFNWYKDYAEVVQMAETAVLEAVQREFDPLSPH